MTRLTSTGNGTESAFGSSLMEAVFLLSSYSSHSGRVRRRSPSYAATNTSSWLRGRSEMTSPGFTR